MRSQGKGRVGPQQDPGSPEGGVGWAWLELGCEHSSVCAGLSLATGGLWWPNGSKDLTRWSNCSPTSECASLTAASAAEQGALLGRVLRASGLEPPPCLPGGAVWSPTLLNTPPMASRGLCAPPPPCTRGSAVWGFSPQPRSTTLLSVTPHCLQKSLCPGTGRRLSCSQMAWSWMSVAGLELKRRHCVRGRRWGAVGGALGVLGRELPALRAPVLGPWVCRPCGRLEISLSLGWVPGQRLGPGDVVPPPSTWDSGGEKAAWARGACQFVTLRRRGMA